MPRWQSTATSHSIVRLICQLFVEMCQRTDQMRIHWVSYWLFCDNLDEIIMREDIVLVPRPGFAHFRWRLQSNTVQLFCSMPLWTADKVQALKLMFDSWACDTSVRAEQQRLGGSARLCTVIEKSSVLFLHFRRSTLQRKIHNKGMCLALVSKSVLFVWRHLSNMLLNPTACAVYIGHAPRMSVIQCRNNLLTCSWLLQIKSD